MSSVDQRTAMSRLPEQFAIGECQHSHVGNRRIDAANVRGLPYQLQQNNNVIRWQTHNKRLLHFTGRTSVLPPPRRIMLITKQISRNGHKNTEKHKQNEPWFRRCIVKRQSTNAREKKKKNDNGA
jgi:hypothetical protein